MERGGLRDPQILADQLTLSQRRAYYAHPTHHITTAPLRMFRPSYGPEIHIHFYTKNAQGRPYADLNLEEKRALDSHSFFKDIHESQLGEPIQGRWDIWGQWEYVLNYFWKISH